MQWVESWNEYEYRAPIVNENPYVMGTLDVLLRVLACDWQVA